MRQVWKPKRKAAGVFEGMLSPLPAAVQDDLGRTTPEILSYCIPPSSAAGSVTGLVFGAVQSGKTSSFTAVAALAADNGYRIVIVVTGTTTNLAEQSVKRLKADLGIGKNPYGSWVHLHNPDPDRGGSDDIARPLDAWSNPDAGDRPVVLITVLKHHGRIRALAEALRRVPARLLGPAILIDDEADQASPNTKAKRNAAEGTAELSSTYAALVELRSRLPHHSFLEYTATPQANLLIPIVDSLSPSFVVPLEPGGGYVGPAEVFREARESVVRRLDPADIPDPAEPLEQAPESLHEALYVFLVGVASAWLRKDRTVKTRTMLIHPAHRQAVHLLYEGWVKSAIGHWSRMLAAESAGGGDDPEVARVRESFRVAHTEVARTLPSLEPFDAIWKGLRGALPRVKTQVVNSWSAVDTIDWPAHFWIVIGGQKLDRGVTVEGLTVTYMPRPAGTGQVDTLNQRARFYGYRLGYLGYCRLYLTADVIHALGAFVDHERHLRSLLADASARRMDVREMTRRFILDARLRPTRDCVLSDPVVRSRIREWVWPAEPQLEKVAENRTHVDRWLADSAPKFIPARAPAIRSRWPKKAELPLSEVIERLLIGYLPGAFDDAIDWQALLVILQRHAEADPDAQCTVFRMEKGRASERDAPGGRIRQLMEGRRESGFPGDRGVRGEGVTVQIHRVTLRDGKAPKGRDLAGDVPVLAVFVPEDVARDTFTQVPSAKG